MTTPTTSGRPAPRTRTTISSMSCTKRGKPTRAGVVLRVPCCLPVGSRSRQLQRSVSRPTTTDWHLSLRTNSWYLGSLSVRALARATPSVESARDVAMPCVQVRLLVFGVVLIGDAAQCRVRTRTSLRSSQFPTKQRAAALVPSREGVGPQVGLVRGTQLMQHHGLPENVTREKKSLLCGGGR